MAGSRYHLTEKIQSNMFSLIRKGAYPHAAAEAAGIPAEVFAGWLRQARRRKWTKYRSFADGVRAAQAQARAKAEMKLLESDARTWLRSGPGKERPDTPGWTTSSRPCFAHLPGDDLFASPAWIELWIALRRVLHKYPRVRDEILRVLAQYDEDAVPAGPASPSRRTKLGKPRGPGYDTPNPGDGKKTGAGGRSPRPGKPRPPSDREKPC